MSIEFYVRTRTSPQDDRRTGTLATGPARVTIGGTVVEVAEGEALLVEVDELTPEGGEPPARAGEPKRAKGKR